MIQDGQVRRLEKLLSREMSLGVAALKAGMNEKTARKYRRESQMPSEGTGKHWWRTRPDPSGEDWEAVGKLLEEHQDCRRRRCSRGCSGSIRETL